jgi:hypothetical protein
VRDVYNMINCVSVFIKNYYLLPGAIFALQ